MDRIVEFFFSMLGRAKRLHIQMEGAALSVFCYQSNMLHTCTKSSWWLFSFFHLGLFMKRVVHIVIEAEWNSWEFWIKGLYRRMFMVWCTGTSSSSCPVFSFTVQCSERFQGKKILFCSLSLTLQLIQARALFSHCIKAQIHKFFFMYQELNNLKNLSEACRFYWKSVLPKTWGAVNIEFDLLHWTLVSRQETMQRCKDQKVPIRE